MTYRIYTYRLSIEWCTWSARVCVLCKFYKWLLALLNNFIIFHSIIIEHLYFNLILNSIFLILFILYYKHFKGISKINYEVQRKHYSIKGEIFKKKKAYITFTRFFTQNIFLLISIGKKTKEILNFENSWIAWNKKI